MEINTKAISFSSKNISLYAVYYFLRIIYFILKYPKGKRGLRGKQQWNWPGQERACGWNAATSQETGGGGGGGGDGSDGGGGDGSDNGDGGIIVVMEVVVVMVVIMVVVL